MTLKIGWHLINETTPREGGKPIVCWRKEWGEPALLMWKTNNRIVHARARGENVGRLADSYFGDLTEYDDYEYAEPGNGPTYWHPLEQLPAVHPKVCEDAAAEILRLRAGWHPKEEPKDIGSLNLGLGDCLIFVRMPPIGSFAGKMEEYFYVSQVDQGIGQFRTFKRTITLTQLIISRK